VIAPTVAAPPPRAARRLGHAVAFAIAACGVPIAADAQEPRPSVRLEMVEPGPGEPGRLLRGVLARPYVVAPATGGMVALPRDTTFGTTVVVIGADATVASRVEGDVVVIGGDLFLRPGATIRGRAIAIGGGVYNSLLARAEGGLVAYRDVTFEPVGTGPTLALHHRVLVSEPDRRLVWPGLYGLRLPSYTRVDGVALTVGPRVVVGAGVLAMEPRATYRSHLGTIDPGLTARLAPGRTTSAELVAERGTFTNDAWARHEVVNSGTTLVFGDDERNYYRATRVGGDVRRRWDDGAGTVEPWIGAQTEDAWSVGPVLGTTSRPWSLIGRNDTTRVLRPNPAVRDGRITSALAGVRASWDDGDLTARSSLRLERPVETPDDSRFTQLTVDATTTFRAIGTHRLELAGHAVLTAGDSAPPQRWAYLGGGSTLRLLPELSLGGDQLLFVEGAYLVPLQRPALPYVGPPTVGLLYVAGAAGVGRLPAVVQHVGVRVMLSVLRVDLLLDPASGETSVGLGYAGYR